MAKKAKVKAEKTPVYLARKPKLVEAMSTGQKKAYSLLVTALKKAKTVEDISQAFTAVGKPKKVGKKVEQGLPPQCLIHAYLTTFALPIPFGNTLAKVVKQMAELE